MPPSAPLPSVSASWLGPLPSASAPGLSPVPDRSPTGVCADTLRRLDGVLARALARIAPDAHPTTPIRFFSDSSGMVRALVTFDGGGLLTVNLLPLSKDKISVMKLWLLHRLGTSYAIGNPTRGVVTGDPATGPLDSDQLQALADEPGLTLES
jgi:hypothetical protein